MQMTTQLQIKSRTVKYSDTELSQKADWRKSIPMTLDQALSHLQHAKQFLIKYEELKAEVLELKTQVEMQKMRSIRAIRDLEDFKERNGLKQVNRSLPPVRRNMKELTDGRDWERDNYGNTWVKDETGCWRKGSGRGRRNG